ncbi:uncharacterized protein LOC134243633, partial [Saccostrea cucullata]|uniref:uncharacterized protein LOC134243633 n=1 Tax=Saccostrea cuccullata TaxID=36930 RepID=UPI002ED1BEE9
MELKRFSTQYKKRQCSQCQGDTEFYCNTCKHDLCLQCKERHVTNSHKVVFYRTKHSKRGYTIQCKVRQCSECKGNTEYFCNTCKQDLCLQCKERHVINPNIEHHDLVLYREKYKSLTKQERCERHPDKLYDRYCLSCEVPVCVQCTEYRDIRMLPFLFLLNKHRTHEMLDLRPAYETNRRKYRGIIRKTRSDTIYNSCFLLSKIKTDLKFCHTCSFQSDMSVKARRLKNLIDSYVKSRLKSLMIQTSQIYEQQICKLNRHVSRTENYVYRFEQSVNKPIKFLSFLKKITVPKMKESPFLTQYIIVPLIEEINRKDVIKSLCEIHIKTAKRKKGIDSVLKLMFTPVLHTFMIVTSVDDIRHISRESPDRFWISDKKNIVLTNTEGDELYRLLDKGSFYGGHTVDITRRLIYVNIDFNIIKLSKETTAILIQKIENWIPLCVFCSHSNGDLLVGMRGFQQTGKVCRYSYDGKLIQTIQHDKKGQAMSGDPNYITENRNGDVVVSVWPYALVVTNREGRYRFSYRGHPSSSGISPQGICTGAMSNILVCDALTDAVHIIDQNGHFLSLIQTQQLGINSPWSLSYDDKTHLLW